jgi:hypothetical protein
MVKLVRAVNLRPFSGPTLPARALIVIKSFRAHGRTHRHPAGRSFERKGKSVMARKMGRRGLFMLLAGVAFLALAARAWQVGKELKGSYGQYTARQVLDITEPLCRALAPQGGDLLLTADRIKAQRQGRLIRFWGVECTDVKGRHVAFFLWNADRGVLQYAGSAQPPLPAADRQAPMNRQEAIRASWRWLCTLGVAGNPEGWRLAGAPLNFNNSWRIAWQRGSLRINAHIDGLSGHLMLFAVASFGVSSPVS